jgi:omega-hydroxy-beta-dihydromenaquinone-9 sulfotransferase
MRLGINEVAGAELVASSREGWAAGQVGLTGGESCSLADRVRTAAALSLLSPLQGMRVSRCWQVIGRDWRRLGPAFWPRASLLAASAVFNTAFACYDERRWRRQLEETVVRPPLFILGHYRSGTTHLQYLFSHNRLLAYPNLVQSFFPHTFLSMERFLARLAQIGLVRHRFQDHVRLSPTSPMEDEIAVCIATGLSPHMSWALPHRGSFYDRFLTFQDATENEVARWKSALSLFVRKLTLRHGRMLVLKSPPHTARIRLLLELFPEARFVHVHRHPYDVFRSTMHMLGAISPYWNVQRAGKHGTHEARVARVLTTYRLMYDAFFEQRRLIPAGHFCELRYEDLERDPTGTLRTVYSTLGLAGIDEQVVGMQDYLAASRGYPKNNRTPIDDRLRRQIARDWERAFAEWGYST